MNTEELKTTSFSRTGHNVSPKIDIEELLKTPFTSQDYLEISRQSFKSYEDYNEEEMSNYYDYCSSVTDLTYL